MPSDLKKDFDKKDFDRHLLPPPQLPQILIKLRIRQYLLCNPFQSDGSLSGADKEQTLIWLRSFAEKQISILTRANSLRLVLNKTCIEQDTERWGFTFVFWSWSASGGLCWSIDQADTLAEVSFNTRFQCLNNVM